METLDESRTPLLDEWIAELGEEQVAAAIQAETAEIERMTRGEPLAGSGSRRP